MPPGRDWSLNWCAAAHSAQRHRAWPSTGSMIRRQTHSDTLSKTPRRSYSLVVLSPDRAGKYLADPVKLSGMLLGLADIVTIPEGADTFWLARVVGKEYVPYNGAAKLIYPPLRRFDGGTVPARTLTCAEAEALATHGIAAADELFSLVVHRSNLPLSWRHISPQVVRETRLKRELAERREAAAKSGNVEEYAKFLIEYVAEVEQDKRELAGTVEKLERLVAAQDDRERQLNFQLDGLKERLTDAGRNPRGGNEAAEDSGPAIAGTVLTAIEKGPTPEEALRLLDYLFADRVVVLPTAWRSARDSVSFRHRQRLYELLHLLAADYYCALRDGQADGDARKVFGASYAATESERVTGNQAARARRTFEYAGRPVQMLKHLKIGRKDSVAETIRVHFEWFADERIIVIGYCGAHIPFK